MSTIPTALGVHQETVLGTVGSTATLQLNCAVSPNAVTAPVFSNAGTADTITVRMYRQDGTLFYSAAIPPQPSSVPTAYFSAYDSLSPNLSVTVTYSSSTASACGLGVALT